MIKNFFSSLALVLILDYLWLGFVMKSFNLRQLAPIGRIENGDFQILYAPALAAYVLMALSLVWFSIPRAQTAGSGWAAFAWGAALGLVIYGIFDMTNMAILRNYPLPFALADMAWGTFLYGAITWILGWKFRAS